MIFHVYWQHLDGIHRNSLRFHVYWRHFGGISRKFHNLGGISWNSSIFHENWRHLYGFDRNSEEIDGENQTKLFWQAHYYLIGCYTFMSYFKTMSMDMDRITLVYIYIYIKPGRKTPLREAWSFTTSSCLLHAASRKHGGPPSGKKARKHERQTGQTQSLKFSPKLAACRQKKTKKLSNSSINP